MSKLLKEPLVHFLAIGGAVFALFAWHSQHAEHAQPPERIVVGAAEVQSLIEAVTILNGGRRPSEAEIEALVEPTIREEVLYREALALGLDEHDADVRRRLVEKMNFLTQDLSAQVPEPDDAALANYLSEHEAQFAVPERVSFEQRFYSSALRGAQVRDDALAALMRLQSGEPDRGDPSLLDERYVHASRAEVKDWFGVDGAEALFTIPVGEWRGPLESQYGLHLVRVEGRDAAHAPSFDEVRDAVEEAYINEQRSNADAAAYRALRAKYDIVIEMPKEGSGESP